MNRIDRRWAWKTVQIVLACSLMNRASNAIGWVEVRVPWVRLVDALYRLYWLIDGLAIAWFCRAYEGSWDEIEMAWDHADEDWLSPFQQLVASGRILPA